MGDAEGARSEGDRPGESEEILRAKYLDYCSAQVADLLMVLSPDEIYLLAQDAARDSPSPASLTYDQIVQLATERLSSKLSLPPFEVWLEDYRSNPEAYERHMMGLWQSELDEPPEEDS